MHTDDLSPWTHEHVFDEGNPLAERGTRLVMWITAAMMVVEIVAGWWFNSMALIADGLHMSSHALAIGLSAFAYAAARRYAGDTRFAFGTWKIEVLAGFASAILLLGVAALMVIGSIEHLLRPAPIAYSEAIVIATLGLAVNIVCALILGNAHHHDRAREHESVEHGHGHRQHHDLNLKSAYLHVIADAATSVLAVTALAGGMLFGWSWLDPTMGLVGAGVVGAWAYGLLKGTSRVLLDREMDDPVVDEIREAVESPASKGQTRIADLHVWRVGKGFFACALTVVTHDTSLTPGQVRQQLAVHREIAHATIEVQQCG
jgi:cation diffusion facilitator family transporter